MKEARIDYDVTQIRKDVKTINPNIDFDLQYLFYYDETNNPRKFFNRENGFNSKLGSRIWVYSNPIEFNM